MANNWAFFEIIHKYASEKHNINPPLIIESCPSQQSLPTNITSTQQHTSTSDDSCLTTSETRRSSLRRSLVSESHNAKKLRKAVLNVSDVFLQFMEMRYGITPTRNTINESDDSE